MSVSTVSLVLNGRDEGRVKPDIAAQVRDTARELGYRPNPLAQSLRTSKTRILGFLSEEIATTPFAGRIILGAQDAASALGYMMLTVNTDGESDESEEISALKRYGVDGFLYAKMFNRVITVPQSFGGYPVVLVDATDSNGAVPGIAPDEFHIGYDAARRLIDAGCSRIAYVGSDSPIVAQEGRRKGYRKALADAGIPYTPGLDIGVGNNRPALDAVSSLLTGRILMGSSVSMMRGPGMSMNALRGAGLLLAVISALWGWITIAYSLRLLCLTLLLLNCRIMRWDTGLLTSLSH